MTLSFRTLQNLALILGALIASSSFAEDSTPSTLAEVQKTLQTLRTQSPSQIRIGDFAAVDTTETLQGTSPIVRLQEATTILEKFESARTFQFRIAYDRTEYRNGQVFHRSEQGQVVFAKGRPNIFERMNDGEYSNLKVEELQYAVPEKVRHRKNCGGLSSTGSTCPEQIPARKVSFDFQDQRGHDWHYEVWGSSAVPFLATPLKLCWTTLVPYGEHELSQTTCKEMKDFNAGPSSLQLKSE